MNKKYLEVENLSKHYKKYSGNFQRFFSWLGLSNAHVESKVVVEDISFSLEQGEAVALVGENGAGKSTLLKLIAGTIMPSSGNIKVHARVSAILELGLGFNIEMSGRENIFTAAAVMGLSEQETNYVFNDIVEFSELTEFINEPVKNYSSGMQARLAFSIATAVRPDILIVDEVLSVGDAYFQHKSFDRIRQFKEQGTSLLFVTHNMSDVRTLCDRAILLENGKVLKDAEAEVVIDYYNALIAKKESAQLTIEQKRLKNGWLYTRSGNAKAVIQSVVLSDAKSSQPISVAQVGQTLELKIVAEANEEIEKLVLGFMLKDKHGHVVWGTNTWHSKQVIEHISAGEKVLYSLSFDCHLGPGSYSFTLALHSDDTHISNNYDWQDNMLVFEVINFNKYQFVGTTYLDATIHTTKIVNA